MDANTEVTLDDVHAGILAAISERFPEFRTVEAYRQDRRTPATPAFLLELCEMEPADDPGTDQLAVMAKFEALLILDFKQPGLNAKLEIRRLAAAVSAFIRLHRWGCPIGAAEFLGAYPDDFTPELDQFEVWRVEWQQVIYLGESVWQPGTRPTTVLGSTSPLIGIPYKDYYEEIAQP